MPGARAQLGRRAAASLHLALPGIAAGVALGRRRPRVRPAALDWPTPATEHLEHSVHAAVTDAVVHAHQRPDQADPGTPQAGGETDAEPTVNIQPATPRRARAPLVHHHEVFPLRDPTFLGVRATCPRRDRRDDRLIGESGGQQ